MGRAALLALSLGGALWALGCDDGGVGGPPSPDAGLGDAAEAGDEGLPDALSADAAPVDPPCQQDADCADDRWCDFSPEALEGACVPGCRSTPEDTCEAGARCNADHQCEVDPHCADDEACEPGLYCGAERLCVPGCRVLDEDLCPFTAEDREQRCDPQTHACRPVVACCGVGGQCTMRFAEDCGGAVLPEAFACVNPNPCVGRCEADADCADEDYCADDGRCRRGCRLDAPDAPCEGLRCDPETRRPVPCACAEDAACPEGFFCAAVEQACVRGCRLEPDDCPEGLFCDLNRQCGRGCVQDAQCAQRNGAGWYCEASECQAPCDRSEDCAPEEICVDTRCALGCRDDALEDNDDAQHATALDFAGRNTYSSRRTPTAICPQDADWFAFQTPADGWDVRVNLRFSHADGDLDVRLHGPDGLEAVGQSVDDDETVELLDAPGGDWRLEVFGRGVDANDYDFEVELTPPAPCVPDAVDPADDLMAQAEALALDGLEANVAVRDRSACVGDVDWFRFELGQGDGLSVRLTMLGNGEDAHTELDFQIFGPGLPAEGAAPVFTPNGQGGGGAGPRFIEFVIPTANLQVAPGEYFLRVAPLGGEERSRYSLDVRVRRARALCAVDDAEPNEDRATALDLMAQPGFTRAQLGGGGEELIPARDLELPDRWICDGDVDWYRLALGPGDGLLASVLRDDAEVVGDVTVEIYGEGAEPLAVGRGAREINTIRLDESAGGDHWVRVAGVIQQTQTHYTLRINRVAAPSPCLPDAWEPNEGLDEPTPVGAGRTEGLRLCAGEGDVDVFRFDTDEVSDITVRLRFDHDQADLQLELYEAGAARPVNQDIAAGHSSTDDEEVRVNDRLPGRWLARVYAVGGGAADYALEVEVTPRVFACADDPHEPNEVFADAVDIGRDPTVIADAWICERLPSEEDWYVFEVRANQRRVVGARFVFGDDGDLVIEAYDFEGQRLASTIEVPRNNSKQCLVVAPFAGDRQIWLRVAPLTINGILEQDERLDYSLEVAEGQDCDVVLPRIPGVEWPTIPAPF